MNEPKIIGRFFSRRIWLGLFLMLDHTLIQAAAQMAPDLEKCYGIAKSGKNDCANAKHACQTQGSKDRDPAEWMLVIKGSCEKISGASLTAKS